MSPEIIEAQIVSTLEKLSNGIPVEYEEEWIEEAGEQFKAALRKQFNPRDKAFRVRMSNIGRPICQIQMEKGGAIPTGKPYNHLVRMMIGDSVEVILRVILKMANVAVTSSGDSVVLNVGGTEVKGDSDIDIDGMVYDIKSASPWAYAHKFVQGYQALAADDSFGYVGQLYGYADAQRKPAGGWIVANKSTGEVCVVPVEASDKEIAGIRARRQMVLDAVGEDAPFVRCYEDEEELYYGRPTGARKLGKACEFCSYSGTCWPDARYLPAPVSRAKNPPYNWYTAYPDA